MRETIAVQGIADACGYTGGYLKHHAMPTYCAVDLGDLPYRARRNVRSMQRRPRRSRALAASGVALRAAYVFAQVCNSSLILVLCRCGKQLLTHATRALELIRHNHAGRRGQSDSPCSMSRFSIMARSRSAMHHSHQIGYLTGSQVADDNEIRHASSINIGARSLNTYNNFILK